MVKEKYLQVIMDLVRERGCVTRRFIIDQLIQLGLTPKTESVVDEVLQSLLKRNIIVRKGRGVYCWSP